MLGLVLRPAKYAFDLALQHGRLDHVLAPPPVIRVFMAMQLNNGAGDQWVTVEPACKEGTPIP